jgi:hypothetical protein
MSSDISERWTPTSKNLDALPSPVRQYIQRLQTNSDPGGLMRENFRLRQENAVLRRKCERLAAMVRIAK